MKEFDNNFDLSKIKKKRMSYVPPNELKRLNNYN